MPITTYRTRIELPGETVDSKGIMWIMQGERLVPLPYALLTEGRELKEIKSYCLIDADLIKAIEALQLLLKLERTGTNIDPAINSDIGLIRERLLISAISSYGKCFNRGDGRVVVLNHNRIFEKDHTALTTHDELIRIRNKYVAHSGGTEHEQVQIRVALNPNIKNKHILKIYSFTATTAGFKADRVEQFLSVMQIAHNYVVARLNECCEKLELALEPKLAKLYETATFADDKGNS
jgi:hypothetical protein